MPNECYQPHLIVKNGVLKLNRIQRKHYLSVKWLLTDGPRGSHRDMPGAVVCKNRQTGRSSLMQLIFVEMAIEHPGVAISYFDHVPGSSAKWANSENFKRLVKKLQEEGLEGQFKVTQHTITYRKNKT